jgi:hypothetical protein
MLTTSVNRECFCNILLKGWRQYGRGLQGYALKESATHADGPQDALDLWVERAEQVYFLYQKIASATKATVMIHRTMSLLRFFSFSSAIAESTPYLKATFKCCLNFLAKSTPYGLAGPPAAADRL